MISIHNLVSSFDTFSLKNISFSFPRNSILSILGPSGSGKTLLLKTIAGLVQQETGSIFIDSEKIDELSPKDRKVGFVFQDYALYTHMNAGQNIGFPISQQKKHKKELETLIRKTAALLHIPEEYLPRYIRCLPEGIKQLVAIARAKTSAVNLYLMDEPMAHLDPQLKKSLRSFIKALIQQLNITAIFSFNDPEDAMGLSDYIAVLDNGGLEQLGTVDELYRTPTSATVMEQMSIYGLNKIKVEVNNHHTIPYNLKSEYPDGYYYLCFRPENVTIHHDGLPVTVREKHFFSGRWMEITAETPGEDNIHLLLPDPGRNEFAIEICDYQLFPESGTFRDIAS